MKFIDPQLLYTFVKLAYAGQFTRAANQVGLSQSAVSQQIQKLESILGVALIDRSKKTLSLTPRGQAFLGRAEKLLWQHEGLIAEFNQNEVSGRIRFGSPEDFATVYLPSILARFTNLYPNVRLEVNCELTLKLLEAFEQGEYDLIVYKQEPSHHLENAVSLWEEPLVWVQGKGYDLDHAIGQENVKLVLAPQPCVYRSRAIEALERCGIGWEQVYTSQSIAGNIAAVRGGLGVTVLPITSVPPDLLHVSHTQEHLPALQATQIKLLASNQSSQAIQAFQDFIKDSLSVHEAYY